MILATLMIVLLVAGVAGLIAARAHPDAPRWIALAALVIDLVLTIPLFFAPAAAGERWTVSYAGTWLPQFGISFHVGADGLSLVLLLLTFFLGIVAVLASWTEIRDRVGFFHFNLLWVLTGITGVFVSLDLFLFYVAWEVMLVPMYLLILLWGHERRVYAAIKFFLFTQLSGLLMLVAILALYVAHGRTTGAYTFDYDALLGTPLSGTAATWMALGFFIAFAVKLPMFPLHTWLPDAHTEAPTAGSVILAGLMLKTGGYGLLRFVVPLFPEGARAIAPFAITLGVAGILYGALLAFAQTDLKRLVAYTSVSHLGFVLLGVFAGTPTATAGAVVTMLAHGVSTGALFVLAGALQERLHTRELAAMGGLWSTAPRLSGTALLFALSSLGLPGLGDFVGEFLVLLGTWAAWRAAAVIAALGILAATLYALRLIERAFRGPNTHGWALPDLRPREIVIAALMIAALAWLGAYPRTFLDRLPSRQAQVPVAARGSR